MTGRRYGQKRIRDNDGGRGRDKSYGSPRGKKSTKVEGVEDTMIENWTTITKMLAVSPAMVIFSMQEMWKTKKCNNHLRQVVTKVVILEEANQIEVEVEVVKVGITVKEAKEVMEVIVKKLENQVVGNTVAEKEVGRVTMVIKA